MDITFFEDFAGIGGFRIGLERAGFKHVASCEKDRYARQNYKANFGSAPTFSDSTKIKKVYSNYVLYTAGFPCQDFSVANASKRKGIEGFRGCLVYNMIERIRSDKPQMFLLENVKGLLSSNDGEDFKIIRRSLKKCGYKVYFKVLNSLDFGVPQNRERVFIVGFRHDIHYPLRDGIFIFPKGRPLEITLYDLLEKDVDEKNYLSEKMQKYFKKHFKGKSLPSKSVFALTSTDYKGVSKQRANVIDEDAIFQEFSHSGEGGKGRGLREYSGVSPTLNSIMGTGGNNVPMIIANTVDCDGYLRTGKRKRVDGKAVLTSVNERRLRRLTPLECFRLQGFPDEHCLNASRAGVSDSQLYKQIGNAVTVTVIEAIGRQMVKFIKDNDIEIVQTKLVG